jgi:serine/threonine protein kinase/Tol biopolymer transport system component
VTLSPGSRLGPYEIVAPLGAGGMGEVYRAKDTRLDRTVAIKVLPDHLSSPEARQRFEREAKTISQLSHPHICALYDVGHQDGVEYLVMEYLDGETLGERLVRGPVPLDQSIRFGIQMAEALDRAHRAGVVHRDLKPGNVMLTRSGVKLLDFGLAKLTAPPSGVVSGLSISPTTPRASNLTAQGAILGTFEYMAPEQLEGREADARTDIFAFGSVLYEMVTGRKAFAGASQASLIASILEKQPDLITSIQPLAPAALDHIIRKCLAKDPNERWQSAADVASELRWAGESSASSHPGVVAAALSGKSRGRLPRILSAAGLLLLGLAAGLLVSSARHGGTPVRSAFSIVPPEKSELADWTAISPDGKFVAFPATVEGTTLVWLRPRDSTEPRPLQGTEGAACPFWSPDGRSLGFFAGGKLKRIDLAGGPAQVLCEAPDARGGTWNGDGVIVFSGYASDGLYRIAASGGNRSRATALDPSMREISHRWPEFLPDGKHFLFYVSGGRSDRTGVYAGELGSARKTLLVPGARRAGYGGGQLFFARSRTLFARRFDANSLELKDEPVSIADHVWFATDKFGHSSFSVSRAGDVVFRSGTPESQLTWVDRAGKVLGTLGSVGLWDEPAVSRNGRRLSAERGEMELENNFIFEIDAAHGTLSRVSPGEWESVDAAWSPDGSKVAFRSNRDGERKVWIRDMTSGREEVALRSPGLPGPLDWTPDGRYLLCGVNVGGFAVSLVPVSGDRTPRQLLVSATRQIQFSPDGRFIVYAAAEEGSPEVYLRRFPLTEERWQVSRGGGNEPRWRADGAEIFYIGSDRRLNAVHVRTAPSIEIGNPVPLFATGTRFVPDRRASYAATPDGQRFLFVVPLDQARPTLTFIENALAPQSASR